MDSALATWARLVTQPEPVTRTVEQVTGVPARSFRQRAEDHAGDFRPLSAAEVADRYVSKRETAVKISLYTVADGAIVREEVYYHTLPYSSGHYLGQKSDRAR